MIRHFLELIDLASRRIRTERLAELRNAFDESGYRSAFRRAKLIGAKIYDRAELIPDVTLSPDRNAFPHEVSEAMREAAKAVGVKLL